MSTTHDDAWKASEKQNEGQKTHLNYKEVKKIFDDDGWGKKTESWAVVVVV